MGKVKITQVRSAIRRPADQKKTLIALETHLSKDIDGDGITGS